MRGRAAGGGGGAAVMRVLIAGDSHCNGYAEAARLWPAGPIAFDVRLMGISGAFHTPFHEAHAGHISFNHDVFYLESLAQRLPHIPLAPGGRAFDWYGFSGIFDVMYLYLYPRFFHERQRLPSRSLFRQIVVDRSRAWIEFLAAARRLELPVFVIESPGLFASSPQVARSARYVDTDELLACDRFARGIVREALGAIDVPVVALVDAVLAPSGFMAEQYRHPDPRDPHHGNLAFAKMMLQQTARLLDRLGPGGTPPELLGRLPEWHDPPDSDNSNDLAGFPGPSQSGRNWIIQPGAQALAAIECPEPVSVEPAGSVSGFAGLRIDRVPVQGKNSYQPCGLRIRLAEDVAEAVSGKRLVVSTLARSAQENGETRFGVALSLAGGWHSKWRWTYGYRQLSIGRFYCELPRLDGHQALSLELAPDTGDTSVLAAAEIFAVAIAICDR